ncbi:MULTISPECIES: NIPSNAP family protein [unclassified Lysobacter]|uniref:NIPSNAP family protein n=1 Tax=unclassified Lysobacter TaxID=2635362 RepID=UPI001BE63F4C|nr:MULTISPECIES: NIPSNAP family protein [unclassified Lysobacter]MBT2748764.1 NIPSNAP family protein [Lysobacter sp. ISL-42]MBT2751699.1 NIPSNAP family protein [Lysobacter sp. ISL-50]MBT2775893.1 NIPSNAP family protein [Lysobacter sp. ISL-54]MBT2782143.1 NIPSNAP family protein [Lysobacter sp. ISL-52]
MLIEIRTYLLKEDAAATFDKVMVEDAIPMIRAYGMDVVAYGQSDHERETRYLIRAYKGRAHLDEQQAEFYASQAWRNGPRPALISCIDTYLNTLLRLSPESVEQLRSN